MNGMLRGLVSVSTLGVLQRAVIAPANAPSRITVAPAGEGGTRLTVRGLVTTDDGRTPLANASIYVYQTDARGYYDPANPRASDQPRLKGFMRTNARGEFEYETIRPGSYPGTRNPGHIHYHVNATGYPERVFEIVFEGDTLIPEQWRRDSTRPDAGVVIVRAEQAGSALRASHTIALRR